MGMRRLRQFYTQTHTAENFYKEPPANSESINQTSLKCEYSQSKTLPASFSPGFKADCGPPRHFPCVVAPRARV